MQILETIRSPINELNTRKDAAFFATGINPITVADLWENHSEQFANLPPKAQWQLLMINHELKTGTSIGDPETQLISADDHEAILRRIQNIKRSGYPAWIGSATWSDPTVWDPKATKPKLWKDIDGDKPESVPFDQFMQELAVERQTRRRLILKTFPQKDSYQILNLHMNPGSIWSLTEDWSLMVEWYSKTDNRENESEIPRSFLISSDPSLCIVCGSSTRAYAAQFLSNNLSRIQQIIDFWSTLHHPPANIECMRENGILLHVNDITIELPKPTQPLSQYLEEYEQSFILPQYSGSMPAISTQIRDIHQAPWVTPREWQQYEQSRNLLINEPPNEGNPENWKLRSNAHATTVRFAQSLAQSPLFMKSSNQ